jgi:hypothetical protein
MVKATPSQQVFLDLIYDQQVTNTPASGTITNIGTETDSALKLLKNQVAEVRFVEITSPLSTAGGLTEKIEYIRPKIDGQDYQGGKWIRMRADADSNVSPHRALLQDEATFGAYGSRSGSFDFGYGLVELVERGVDQNQSLILQNCTPKIREAGTIDWVFEIGNAALTGNLRVKVYALRYTSLDVANKFTQLAYSGGRKVDLVDNRNGRDFTTTISPEYGDAAKDWTKLLGGNDMKLRNGVNVQKFHYWARNKGATTASVEFNLSFLDSKVNKVEQNMDIAVDDNELYYVTELGLRDGTNHKDLLVRANDKIIWTDRTVDGVNNYKFGRLNSQSLLTTFKSYQYRSVPNINPLFGSNEQFKVLIKDSGSTIADGTNFGNGDLVVWGGFHITDPLYSADRANRI